LLGTEYSTGGSVEHQLFTAEGILLNISELKIEHEGGRTKKDNFAQVMVELACTRSFSLPTGC
jgi:hypothetical protein